MPGPGHRFFLVFRDASATLVHEEEIKDLASLWQDVVFPAVCAGELPNDGRWGPVTVEPDFADGKLSGVTVGVAGVCRSYGLSIFADRAWETLLHRGLIKDADTEETTLRWKLEVRVGTDGPARRRLAASVTPHPFPLLRRPLSDFGITERARHEPFSLFICSRLFSELREESANSLERERANFLTGHLAQEPEGPVAVVALDRIPADVDTTSSAVHFSFSPLTFQSARQELERRGTDQRIVGWAHNHPPQCGRECLMTIPACKTENVFCSIADRSVHRASFAAPYMVAFIAGKGAHRGPDDPLVRAYQWRAGLIRESTFSVF